MYFCANDRPVADSPRPRSGRGWRLRSRRRSRLLPTSVRGEGAAIATNIRVAARPSSVAPSRDTFSRSAGEGAASASGNRPSRPLPTAASGPQAHDRSRPFADVHTNRGRYLPACGEVDSCARAHERVGNAGRCPRRLRFSGAGPHPARCARHPPHKWGGRAPHVSQRPQSAHGSPFECPLADAALKRT